MKNKKKKRQPQCSLLFMRLPSPECLSSCPSFQAGGGGASRASHSILFDINSYCRNSIFVFFFKKMFASKL